MRCISILLIPSSALARLLDQDGPTIAMSETLLILDATTDASDVGPEYNEEEGGEDVMRCKVADVSQVVSSTDGVRAMDGGVLVGTNSCSRSSRFSGN